MPIAFDTPLSRYPYSEKPGQLTNQLYLVAAPPGCCGGRRSFISKLSRQLFHFTRETLTILPPREWFIQSRNRFAFGVKAWRSRQENVGAERGVRGPESSVRRSVGMFH